jgi:hypothetical protein
MEKSTISALIVAGAGMVGAILQVLVLRAAKKKRTEEQQAQSEERMRQFDEEHGIDESDSG